MRQSVMIGYLNAFTMYTVASALAVVFVLMVRRRRPAEARRLQRDAICRTALRAHHHLGKTLRALGG